MILQRLYELALREGLLEDPAFECQPIPWVIQIGKDGEFLGIQEQRGVIETPSKKKGAPPTSKPDRGKERLVPRAHGNTANRGFARYFADTIPRVLPVLLDAENQAKADASRVTFWQQIERAATESQDPSLLAVLAFGRQLSDPELVERIRNEATEREVDVAERCTFAWNPDYGLTILERDPVKAWYREFYRGVQVGKQAKGPQGVCQITGEIGPIPKTHTPNLQRVPGGLSTGVSLASYDKPAFVSYGLAGTENAAVGYKATEGYLRALQALIDKRLEDRSGKWYSCGVLFLYWTRERSDVSVFECLDKPVAEHITKLLEAPYRQESAVNVANVNAFYLLAISANAARAILRDYLELPLPRVQDNLRAWFADLRIADASRESLGRPSSLYPLSRLALATALDFDNVLPETTPALFHAALSGTPLPESLLAACARRLRVEGASGCHAARMALIKIILLRRNVPVSESLAENDRRPAYVYGRLLRIFEQIQYAALGDVNANVVDRFYGTFSAAPGLVFSRLYNNVQNHLRKLRSEKPGAAANLDRLLTEVSNLLPPELPHGQFSLREQGLFALGYYHQKAHDYARAAENRNRKAAGASQVDSDNQDDESDVASDLHAS